MSSLFEERRVAVDGIGVRSVIGGDGPPLILLHGIGETADCWRWVLPALARAHGVYAPDLPGFGDSPAPAAGYSSGSYASFIGCLLDALGLERAILVGSSLGGAIAIRVALAEPARIAALVLVAGGGLGRAVSPLLVAETLPGCGELVVAGGRTRLGAWLRARVRAAHLFARPGSAPRAWMAEQERLARRPEFLQRSVAALRAQIGPLGQREVLLDRLPNLTMPTGLVWGTRDRVLPCTQARAALARLARGRLSCGTAATCPRSRRRIASSPRSARCSHWGRTTPSPLPRPLDGGNQTHAWLAF